MALDCAEYSNTFSSWLERIHHGSSWFNMPVALEQITSESSEWSEFPYQPWDVIRGDKPATKQVTNLIATLLWSNMAIECNWQSIDDFHTKTSIYRGAFPAMFDIVWLLKSIFWSRDIQWIYASDCYLAMYTTAMESKDKSSYRCWKFSPALLCCYMLHMLLYMSFFMLHQFGPGRTVSCIGSRSHATFPEEFVP